MSLLTFVLQSIAGTTFIVSRPFLAVFGIAALSRLMLIYSLSPVLMHTNIDGMEAFALGTSTSIPWMLSTPILVFLFALVVVEHIASKSEDWSWFYNKALGVLQPGSAFAMTFSLGDWQYTAWVEMVAQVLPPEVLAAYISSAGHGGALASGASSNDLALAASMLGTLGHVAVLVWAGIIAVGTWAFGRLRAAVVGLVFEFDEDNSLGTQGLLHWAETSWTVVGVFVLVIAPVVALILFGITLASLFGLRKYLTYREQRSLVACATCGTAISPSAPHCMRCRQPQERVFQIGFFGQSTSNLVIEPVAHRFQLIGRKRCPFCATHLKERSVHQTCVGCGTVTFEDISALNTYLRVLDQKLPHTALICFVLSLIPFVGLVPGIVYYRLSLIAGLKAYLPRSVGCMTRWGVRFINIILIMMQPIPVLGGAVLPLMCAINYGVYRKVILHESASKIHRTFAPLGGPLPSSGATATLTAPLTVGEDQAPVHTACANCQATYAVAPRFCMRCGTPMRPNSAS